jgi:cysteinyl-tRNA synthetase
LAVLQTLARDINTARQTGKHDRAALLGEELRSLAGTMGIAQLEPAEWFRSSSRTSASIVHLERGKLQRLIDARGLARRSRNWQEADRIRAELAASGVILEDKSDGQTIWRRA